MTERVWGVRIIAAALAAASPGAIASAQEAGAAPVGVPGGVDEILVTAERREANLQDVPISITAFTAEGLEARGVTAVGDALDYAPNVSRTAGPSGGNFGGFFIRGVGQLDNSVAVDPGVGVYIDEIYIARTQATSFDLFDIARVEVLRGPQGTLFGRNTIGGAISVVTQDPGRDLSGALRVTTGSRNRIDVAGQVSGPLSETTGVRLSAFTRNQDGLGRNQERNLTFGDVETIGGRFTLKSEPAPGFTVRATGDFSRGRGTPSHQILLGFNRGAGITVPRPPMLGGPFFVPGVSPTGVPFPMGIENERSEDRFRNFTSADARFNFDSWGLTLAISGELAPNLVLRSITGYRVYDEDQASDFDATGFGLYDTTSTIEQNQLSQEFQLAGDLADGRLTFLLGAYYFAERVDNRIVLCTGSNRPRGVPGCLKSDNLIDIDTTSLAGFANIGWNITDRLELLGGIRFTRETKRQTYLSILDNRDGVPSVLPPFVMPPPGTARTVLPLTTVKADFDATTPRLGVNFKATDNVLLYGFWARGFKSGGFSGRPSNQEILPYRPETVETFEIGAKTELFDRRLRLNLSAFTSDYSDLQLLVFVPATGLFETANAGDARIRGFEVEALARLGGFDLGASVGYLDAGYKRISPLVIGVSLDDRLPLTSDWTVGLFGQYNLPIGDNGELRLRADWNYRSEFAFQIENDPLEVQKGYGLLNLRATYVFPNDRFRIAVFGTNVTGERYFQNMQDARDGNGVAFGGPGAPAEWGAELTIRF
ncbi:MAG: TonB-dependent receptor [Thermaurantiacus sp.]